MDTAVTGRPGIIQTNTGSRGTAGHPDDILSEKLIYCCKNSRPGCPVPCRILPRSVCRVALLPQSVPRCASRAGTARRSPVAAQSTGRRMAVRSHTRLTATPAVGMCGMRVARRILSTAESSSPPTARRLVTRRSQSCYPLLAVLLPAARSFVTRRSQSCYPPFAVLLPAARSLVTNRSQSCYPPLAVLLPTARSLVTRRSQPGALQLLFDAALYCAVHKSQVILVMLCRVDGKQRADSTSQDVANDLYVVAAPLNPYALKNSNGQLLHTIISINSRTNISVYVAAKSRDL